MRAFPIFVALGAGVGALVLWSRRALATEDDTGQTLASEEDKEARAARSALGSSKTLGARAVVVGLRYLGTAESPSKSNRGPVVDRFNRGRRGDGEKLVGKPWCARFARYCYEEAAEELGLPPPFAGIKGTLAAVTSWPTSLKGYETPPKPGAVGILLKKGVRHATIVIRTEGDKVVTVEGNHKGRVALVSRPKSDFAVFLDVERRAAAAPRVVGLIGLDVYAAGCC